VTAPEPVPGSSGEAMSDARLAEIRHDLTGGYAYTATLPARAHAAVARQLLAEVDRLRGVETGLRDAIGDRDLVTKKLRKSVEEIRQQRDAAREELAALRAAHPTGPPLYAWHEPGGRYIHGNADWIRDTVAEHGGTFAIRNVCGYAGPWRDATEADLTEGDDDA
jgi:hypothetical protein